MFIQYIKKITSNPNLNITTDTRFDDIEDWDSLNTVNMEMELESIFSISFETGEFGEIETVGELIDSLSSKLN